MTTYINGKKYNVPPNASISIINGRVYANGNLVEDTQHFTEKEINIVVHGNTGDIESENGSVTVEGSAQSVETMSGDVTIGKDSGNIQTMSGNVEVAGTVNGGISTMSGAITHR